MGAQFLHGFDTAPSHNVRLVAGYPGEVQFIGSKTPFEPLSAAKGLARKQAIATELAGLPLSEVQVKGCEPLEFGGEAVEPTKGWRSLTEDVQHWIKGHVAGPARENPDRYGYPDSYTAEESLVHAAKSGLATVTAFLEVIPKVAFRIDFKEPEAELSDYAVRSSGLIMEWMGLHPLVDESLAYALASPKPPRIEQVFDDLHFSPRDFIADTDSRRVTLNPTTTSNLRDDSQVRHPSYHQLVSALLTPDCPDNKRVEQRSMALLGCPLSRKMMRQLYGSVVQQASERRLFSATYHAERQQYGY